VKALEKIQIYDLSRQFNQVDMGIGLK